MLININTLNFISTLFVQQFFHNASTIGIALFLVMSFRRFSSV